MSENGHCWLIFNANNTLYIPQTAKKEEVHTQPHITIDENFKLTMNCASLRFLISFCC